MKNIIYINATNGCSCDLISNINDGTNGILIEIKSDLSLNPVLHVGSTTVAITVIDFIYQIPNDLITAGSNLTFYISDDSHTGNTFTIVVSSNLNGNWFLKQESDFVYNLSTDDKELPYYTKTEIDDRLKNTPYVQHCSSSGDGYVNVNLYITNPSLYGVYAFLIRFHENVYIVCVNTNSVASAISKNGVTFTALHSPNTNNAITDIWAALVSDSVKDIRVKLTVSKTNAFDIEFLTPYVHLEQYTWAQS